jgi:hypothetical protein
VAAGPRTTLLSSGRCRRSGWPEQKKDALAAFDTFIETWGAKYDKAVECLIKDRNALLAFYDVPFATVRHRTVRSKGCLSNKAALAMIFKLAEAAEKH